MAGENFNEYDFIQSEENSLNEKKRIADVGAAALFKLNVVMKQMKDWRKDRATLKSNICQLKTALRDAGRVVDSSLYSDSFIEHRRNEVKRLKTENEVLKKELVEMKNVLKETKEKPTHDIPSWKCDPRNFSTLFTMSDEYFDTKDLNQGNKTVSTEHFMQVIESLRNRIIDITIGDQNVEVLFVDVLGKAAEAIANLCEEVVNVTENLHCTKFSNEDLRIEIDKLKAMLRSKTGDRRDYEERISEFGSLSKELKNHINMMKSNLEIDSWKSSLEYRNLLIHVEELANNLKNRLESDREALVSAGDPDCLNYLKRVIELRLSLRCLFEGVINGDSNVDLEYQRRTVDHKGYVKKISTVTNLLKEIDVEIEKFRDGNLLKHYRQNNIDSRRYLMKLEEIELIVRNAKKVINSLKWHACVVAKPNDERKTEKLEDLIGRLCEGIKELEMIVLSQDLVSLFKRIEELEKSIVGLRLELTEKDERANTLGEKFSNTRFALEQKIRELKDTQKRIAVLVEENKTFKEKTKAMEERIVGLRHECESGRKQIREVQQVKCEAASLRKKLCSLEADKEAQLNEIKKVLGLLHEREKQIESIVTEHNSKENVSRVQLETVSMKLRETLQENEKLKTKIQELTTENGQGDAKRFRQLIRKSEIELEQLRTELNESKDNFDSVNRELVNLKIKLEDSSNDRERLEASISRLESDRDALQHQLDSERSNMKKRLEESANLMSKNRHLETEVDRMKQERIELQSEKDEFRKLLEDLNAKYMGLKNNVDIYKYEYNVLHNELNSSQVASEDLVSTLENAQSELNATTAKIKRLEFENSEFHNNLDGLTLKNSEVEERVQVLLTENNDLATRINEVSEENVSLQDQLNKAKGENEYFSIELHKSRTENDKARKELARLQDTSAQIKRSNVTLKRTNDKLREKINVIQNMYKELENELKSLKCKKEMLEKNGEAVGENRVLKRYSSKLNRHGRIGKTKEGQLVIISNAILRNESNLSNKSKESKRIRNDEKDLTVMECGEDSGRTAKLEARVNGVDEGRKATMKRLQVENEALKFELTNLRMENSGVRGKLSRTKDELEKLRIELIRIKEYAEAIRPVTNKLTIMNLCNSQQSSRYPTDYSEDYSKDAIESALAIRSNSYVMRTDGDLIDNRMTTQWNIRDEDEVLFREMKRLKIQNIALMKENTSLRSYVFVVFAEKEKTENELRDSMDEILALRMELQKLREERESLRVRLDTARMELDKLKSEKIAMKDELITLKNENFKLRQSSGVLRSDYRKLEQTNSGLEDSLMKAARLINKHTISKGNSEGLREQLKNILQEYLRTKDSVSCAEY